MGRSREMHKMFSGKRYYLYDTGFPNKGKAKSKAVELRKQGYNVRILHIWQSNTYALYRRHRR